MPSLLVKKAIRASTVVIPIITSILIFILFVPRSTKMVIQNVAVVGASGNLGAPVVQALLDAGFNVTALTRIDSKSTFPAGVNVQKVDYSSSSSIADALKGQDAVVSTLATLATGQQASLVDEAVKAGVKRFIPSEFGINTQKATGGAGQILAGKAKLQEKLNSVAAANPDFSWTGLSTGMFFDWGLKVGSVGFNIKDKTATIWDSGNEQFTGSNLYFIGQAVASVLKHPEQTANKYLEVASFVTSQNEILKIFEEETSSKWTVSHNRTDDAQKTGEEKFAKGDYSSFREFLTVHLYADGKGQPPKEGDLANKLLGLKEEDLRTTIKAALA